MIPLTGLVAEGKSRVQPKRGAVLGELGLDDVDSYRIQVVQGQSVSVIASPLSDGEVRFSIFNSDRRLITKGISNAEDGTSRIDSLLTNESGTLYIQVEGDSDLSYSLVVSLNADLHAIDSSSQAVSYLGSSEVGGKQYSMGYIGKDRLFATLFDEPYRILEIDPLTGETLRRISSPVFTYGANDGLAFDGKYLYAYNFNLLHTIEPETSVLLNSTHIEAGDSGGLAYLNGYIYVLQLARNTILKYDPLLGEVVAQFTVDRNLIGGIAGIRNPNRLLAITSAQEVLEIDADTGAVHSSFSTNLSSISGVAVVNGWVYLSDSSNLIHVYRRDGTFEQSIRANRPLGALGGGDFDLNGDYYKVAVSGKESIEIETMTIWSSSSVSGLPLNAILRLFDEKGNLVASNDDGASDQRNAKLTFTNPRSSYGEYLLEVNSSNQRFAETAGEYGLSVRSKTKKSSSLSVNRVEFQTQEVVPNATLRGPITELTIDFSQAVDFRLLEGSGWKLDDREINDFDFVDGDTVVLRFPASMPDGRHVLTIASGELTDIRGATIQHFELPFMVDTIAPRVISSSLQKGDVLLSSVYEYVVTVGFSEPMERNVANWSVWLYTDRNLVFIADSIVFNELGNEITARILVDLTEGEAHLMLSSLEFRDLAGIGLDGEALQWPIPSNSSGDGFEWGDFDVLLVVDAPTRSINESFLPRLPIGGQIYESAEASHGVILGSGDVDDWTLNLDPGQTLSLIMETTAGLIPMIEVLSPNGTVLASASGASINETLILQTIVIDSHLLYTIRIRGMQESTGDYSIRLYLNTVLEEEAYLQSANDQISLGQSIEEDYLEFRGGGKRAAVIGQIANGINQEIAQEDFETGVLGSRWTRYSSDPEHGRIDLGSYPIGTGGGNYSLRMDTWSFGFQNLNEAIWEVDLSSQSGQVLLQFDHAQTGYFTKAFEGAFDHHFDADGVAISNDGVRWYPVWTPNSPLFAWESVTVDLSQQASQWGISLDDASFFIKFQQYGQYPAGHDGRGWDDIRVGISDAADIYRVPLIAGEVLNLAIKGIDPGSLNIELLNSAGTVIATGTSSDSKVEQWIRYSVLQSSEYFIRIVGSMGINYSLLVLRDAVFDIQSNATPNQVIPLGLVDGRATAIGSLDTEFQSFQFSDSGWYSQAGFHNPMNMNYFTGYEPGNGELRGFWTFSLSALSPEVTVRSGWMEIFSALISDTDYTERIELHDVTTPVNQVTAGGAGRVDIFQDLGNGDVYGARDVFYFDDNRLLQIDLTPEALLDLKSAAGGSFAIGAALTSIDFTRPQQNLFGDSGAPSMTRRLVLEVDEIDRYEIVLTQPRRLDFLITAPGSGDGAFANTIDTKMRILDVNQNVVAQDDNSADGRQPRISSLQLAAGRYTIEVGAVGGMLGEYVLSVEPSPTGSSSGRRSLLGSDSKDRGISSSERSAKAVDRAMAMWEPSMGYASSMDGYDLLRAWHDGLRRQVSTRR